MPTKTSSGMPALAGLAVVAALLVLAGCGSDAATTPASSAKVAGGNGKGPGNCKDKDKNSDKGQGKGPACEGGDDDGPATKYDLASNCFVMKADGAYTVRSGTDFLANGTDAATAEKFHMRAANLGRYIFYTPDEQFLTAAADPVSGGSVSATAEPSDGSDWTFEHGENGFHASTLGGAALAVGADGVLTAGSEPATLTFERAEGCTDYPEMPTSLTGVPFKTPVGSPVLGFAEVHTHMAMGMEMSDGSKNVGPSAGGVMWGHAVNRFGVTHALGDCAAMHGPDGIWDAEALVLDTAPGRTHDTQGWPTFVDWPMNDSFLHQQMYWKWLERAWMSGLRTMTVHGTNIEALCDVAKQTGNDKDADLADTDCTDMGVGMKQVAYVHDIQDYVDAQYGGPGKGWYRIVGSPAEAREVIAEGKLAVIPGLEFSNIFQCNVWYNPDGSETHGCTKEDIDQQIDEAWDAGVRQLFLYHDVDSALGGTGIFSSGALNLVNFYGTRGFWKTYPCEDGGSGPKFFYNAGAVMESDPLSANDPSPISETLIEYAAGRHPYYGPGRQCNARTVTELGLYAIDAAMKKGFVLDLDHAEIKSKQIMLDYAAQMEPAYPMVSGHGGHGGISNAQARQMIAQGGIIYPGNSNGRGHVDFVNKVRPIWEASGTTRPLSVGYGADANGLRTLPGPRGAGAQPVVYPFTLFQGADWGPQFDGVEPVTFDMLAVPGGKAWDMNEGGMYHYGLIADIVEEIRIEGGKEALDTFYNSAETYLQLWEQTEAAAASARLLPAPAVTPNETLFPEPPNTAGLLAP